MPFGHPTMALPTRPFRHFRTQGWLIVPWHGVGKTGPKSPKGPHGLFEAPMGPMRPSFLRICYCPGTTKVRNLSKPNQKRALRVGGSKFECVQKTTSLNFGRVGTILYFERLPVREAVKPAAEQNNTEQGVHKAFGTQKGIRAPALHPVLPLQMVDEEYGFFI